MACPHSIISSQTADENELLDLELTSFLESRPDKNNITLPEKLHIFELTHRQFTNARSPPPTPTSPCNPPPTQSGNTTPTNCIIPPPPPITPNSHIVSTSGPSQTTPTIRLRYKSISSASSDNDTSAAESEDADADMPWESAKFSRKRTRDRKSPTSFLSKTRPSSPNKKKPLLNITIEPQAQNPTQNTPCTPQSKTPPPSSPIPPSTPQVVESSKRVPPVILHSKNGWAALEKVLADKGIDFFAKNLQKNISLHPKTPRDHHRITKVLLDKNIDHHSYKLPEDKPLRVVLRGIPEQITSQEISDVLGLSYPVISVHRMRSGPQRKEIPLMLVNLTKNETSKKIFTELTTILHLKIIVEPQRRRLSTGQCHRCQTHGHSSSCCNATPRCVKCGQDHPTSSCIKSPDTPATCALCSGPHPANYKGCPERPTPLFSNRFRYVNPQNIRPLMQYSIQKPNPAWPQPNFTNFNSQRNTYPRNPQFSQQYRLDRPQTPHFSVPPTQTNSLPILQSPPNPPPVTTTTFPPLPKPSTPPAETIAPPKSLSTELISALTNAAAQLKAAMEMNSRLLTNVQTLLNSIQ